MIIIPSIDSPNQNKIKVEHSPKDNEKDLEKRMQKSFNKTDNSINAMTALIIILLIAFIIYWIIRFSSLINSLNEAKEVVEITKNLTNSSTIPIYEQIQKLITEWVFIGLFVLGLFIILFKIETQIKNCLDISEVVNIKTNKINKKVKENSKKSE